MAWLIFLVLCILFPVAIYCFFLALINRRRHPTMVSGSWDFAGVLFALSGFLLIGGPLVLAGLNQIWRSLWLRSDSDSALALGENWWFVRLALWALYFGAISAGAMVLLWKRARVTSIYNVDPAAFEEALARTLNQLQVKSVRAGNRVFIDFAAFPDGTGQEGKISGLPQPAIISEGALQKPQAEELEKPSYGSPTTLPAPEILGRQSASVLLLDPFPTMRHVTLRWPQQAGPWRQEIEAELNNALLISHTGGNPVALWLMSIGSTLMCLIFFVLALLVFVALLPPAG